MLAPSTADGVSTAQSSSTPVSAAAPSSGNESDSGKEGRQVEVRWYDARARTALKKVAVWINVPWTKMATFECLAAEQAQVHLNLLLVRVAFCDCGCNRATVLIVTGNEGTCWLVGEFASQSSHMLHIPYHWSPVLNINVNSIT